MVDGPASSSKTESAAVRFHEIAKCLCRPLTSWQREDAGRIWGRLGLLRQVLFRSFVEDVLEAIGVEQMTAPAVEGVDVGPIEALDG